MIIGIDYKKSVMLYLTALGRSVVVGHTPQPLIRLLSMLEAIHTSLTDDQWKSLYNTMVNE